MSNDLIRRQDAINAISCDITVTGRQNAELVAATIGTFADRIKVLPAAQPTIDPRAKGEWVYGEHDVTMCDGYRCTHCGFFVPWDYSHALIDFIKDYHFCPSCGYPMRQEEKK